MRVLLLEDVYKLGRAGDVKKVADGYGRNYLFPKGLAVLATPGALKQSDRIRTSAETQRTKLNEELGGVAERRRAYGAESSYLDVGMSSGQFRALGLRCPGVSVSYTGSRILSLWGVLDCFGLGA